MAQNIEHFYPFQILIDDEDQYHLNYKWYHTTKGYYVRIVKEQVKNKLKYTYLTLHREILKITKDKTKVIEFVNGNKNDVRKANLKIITPSQSQIKKFPNAIGATPTPSGKYKAQIGDNNTKRYLGSFDTKEEAIIQYLQEREKSLSR